MMLLHSGLFSILFIWMIVVSGAIPLSRNEDGIIHFKQDENTGQAKTPKLVSHSKDFLTNRDANIRDVKMNWGCELCKVIIGLIQSFVEQNKTETQIEVEVRKTCIKLKVEDETVCEGIVKVYESEVLTVVNNLALNPTEICSFTFGSTCSSAYDPFKMWFVEFPPVPKPPVKPILPPKPGSPTVRVLHLTDIHVDMMYTQGYEVNCGEPICCRRDYGRPVTNPAPKWGSFSGCDLPWRTLENLFQHLSTKEKFDYIIMTGDIPAHYVWLSNKADTEFLMQFLTRLFLKYFPGIPVYSTLGNHEAVPVNSFPPDLKVVPKMEKEDWLYRVAFDTWKQWLPKDTMETILRGGFYTALLKPGFRIVSMNMNYCMDKNWWLLLNMTDPNGQLKWLIEVLQKAEDNDEKVHILGHGPPGNSDCRKAWSWNYYNIINRYESTVVAQFFGHTHYDLFQLFYDPLSNLTRSTAVAYIAPAVEAGNSGNNGFKIYTVDGDYQNSTKMVLDHDNYIMNLTDANAGNQPQWYKTYSAKDAFNMTSLFPTDWNSLVNQMKTDNVLFNKFYKFYYKMHPLNATCDQTCRQYHLCSLKTGRTHDPQLCADLDIKHTDFHDWQKSIQEC